MNDFNTNTDELDEAAWEKFLNDLASVISDALRFNLFDRTMNFDQLCQFNSFDDVLEKSNDRLVNIFTLSSPAYRIEFAVSTLQTIETSHLEHDAGDSNTDVSSSDLRSMINWLEQKYVSSNRRMT